MQSTGLVVVLRAFKDVAGQGMRLAAGLGHARDILQ